VVVEAAEPSGTRWTFLHALDQNREVFCVPGSIFSPASRFTNRMIKEGAKLVADYTDILEELNLTDVAAGDRNKGREPSNQADTSKKDITKQEYENTEELEPGEAALMGHLSGHPLHVDDLSRQAGLPIASVTSMLTLLELKGKVEQIGSMHYVKASSEPGAGQEVTHDN
jgi:DNA processing protein